jgi:hypothetical protein
MTYKIRISHIINSLVEYSKKNYRWLIGIIISVLIVPFGIWLPGKLNPDTKQYYYLTGSNEITSPLKRVKCWPSRESTRFEALSCSENNQADNASRIDPCFVRDDFKTLECPSAPTTIPSYYVIFEKINVAQYVNRPAVSNPWYLVLDNGKGCSYFIGGASAFLDGRIDYICNDSKTLLSGPIIKDSSHWTIRCTNSSKNRVENCTIREAWY